jgi:hypothetical protein
LSKKLPELVLEDTKTELKPHGFKLLKAKKRFVRITDGRTETFILVILVDKVGYRVCPCVGVRFERVEEIFHRTSGFEPKYQKDTSTVGIDMFAVYGKAGFQLPLKDEADVEMVTSRLGVIFREKAMSYFAQFSTLSDVDMSLNDRPKEDCIHAILPWLRCSKGAIVAKLTNRTNYKQLIAIYRELVRKDANGYYLPQFEALLQDLAGMPRG